MADRPVNLNRARKRKAQAQRERDAGANRALHGQTKADRERIRLEKERAERAHEQSRLEDD